MSQSPVMSVETDQYEILLNECESVIAEIYARCVENAPNFGDLKDCFKNSLSKNLRK